MAERRGVQVERYNLAQQPMSFVQNEKAKAFLEASGAEGLPLLLLDGETVMAGRYPKRAELARWFGIPLEKVGVAPPVAVVVILPVVEYVRRTYEIFTEYPALPVFYWQGGVGKTSISCATAIRLAEQGKRVLLVSTDPASNVGQVFDQTIGNTIQPVTAVLVFRLWRLTRRTPPSNTAPESLTLLKVFCLMTLLTASVNSFQELVRQRLLRSTSLLAY
jgi:hypothetical protein